MKLSDFYAEQKNSSIKVLQCDEIPTDAPMNAKGMLTSAKFATGGWQEYASYHGTTTDVRSCSYVHKRYFSVQMGIWSTWISLVKIPGMK